MVWFQRARKLATADRRCHHHTDSTVQPAATECSLASQLASRRFRSASLTQSVQTRIWHVSVLLSGWQSKRAFNVVEVIPAVSLGGGHVEMPQRTLPSRQTGRQRPSVRHSACRIEMPGEISTQATENGSVDVCTRAMPTHMHSCYQP